MKSFQDLSSSVVLPGAAPWKDSEEEETEENEAQPPVLLPLPLRAVDRLSSEDRG